MIIDTQSVRVAAGVPKATTGLDANAKTPGRKRGLAVNVLGLILNAPLVCVRCCGRLGSGSGVLREGD